jgi:hypothetical protein
VLTIKYQERFGIFAKLQGFSATDYLEFCCLLCRQYDRSGDRTEAHVDVVGNLLRAIRVENALEAFLRILVPRCDKARVSKYIARHR